MYSKIWYVADNHSAMLALTALHSTRLRLCGEFCAARVASIGTDEYHHHRLLELGHTICVSAGIYTMTITHYASADPDPGREITSGFSSAVLLSGCIAALVQVARVFFGLNPRAEMLVFRRTSPSECVCYLESCTFRSFSGRLHFFASWCGSGSVQWG